MQYITKPIMQAFMSELRALAPRRPLTYGESIQVARRQATRLRQWTGALEPNINLLWLLKQRAVPVSLVPSYQLNESSGLATDLVSGKLEIYINEGEPAVRQRFSLLHEFKHALDFADASVLHAKLGSGNVQRQADQIEWIANDFAANVLMPTRLVKRAWFATQNIEGMATLFNVSAEAMVTRVERLGLRGEPKPLPRVYFRRQVWPLTAADEPIAA